MYRILKEFNVKYKADTLAEFTEETAEKIMASGAYIELIEEPTEGKQPSVTNLEGVNPQGDDNTEENDNVTPEDANLEGVNPQGDDNKVISSRKNNR